MRNSLLSVLFKITHPIQGEIWCLHRVTNERSIFPSNRALEITPEYLENQILEHLNNGFQFKGIDEIMSVHSILRRKWINISFDDGFVDIYKNAFPIFQKYNIPFTIFLATDIPNGTADIWWIQLEKHIANITEYQNIINLIYNSKSLPSIEMHNITNTTPDLDICNELSLSWQQLQEMVDSGLCTIGSHTCSHAALSKMESIEIINELTESKLTIENHLNNVKVKMFSYPHSFYNKTVMNAVRQAGYSYAFIGYGGRYRRFTNKYKINRKYIIQD